MDFIISPLGPSEYPPQLLEIPDPPTSLKRVGAPIDPLGRYLAVVGSRTNTRYGADACEKLILGLRGSDITIVSGLALGIDSVAHRSALKAGLRTIAFPGSGLGESVLYPATNLSLAKEILASGGTLVSEYANDFRATEWSFPRRNRLIAGIAQAVLIVEAADKSGTLITASLALDYNREVFAVPGPITSSNSLGTNLLIKQGSTPITRSEDILEFFGLVGTDEATERESEISALTNDERAVYDLLVEPMSRDTIVATLQKPTHEINILISSLEIKGIVKEELGEVRRVS
ncbi:MAG: DNA-processing protein DprA [bacterium]